MAKEKEFIVLDEENDLKAITKKVKETHQEKERYTLVSTPTGGTKRVKVK